MSRRKYDDLAGRLAIVHMRAPRRYGLYCVSLAVWATGSGWLLVHYLATSTDRFGFEKSSPAEHWLLILHAGFSFYALWWFGLLWSSHVTRGWRAHLLRGTGSLIFGCTSLLSVSGCSLYYVVSDNSRSVIAILHWSVGLGALIAFIVHSSIGRRLRAAG